MGFEINRIWTKTQINTILSLSIVDAESIPIILPIYTAHNHTIYGQPILSTYFISSYRVSLCSTAYISYDNTAIYINISFKWSVSQSVFTLYIMFGDMYSYRSISLTLIISLYAHIHTHTVYTHSLHHHITWTHCVAISHDHTLTHPR